MERHSRVPLRRRELEGRAVPEGIGSALSQVLPQTGAPVVANNKCKPGWRTAALEGMALSDARGSKIGVVVFAPRASATHTASDG